MARNPLAAEAAFCAACGAKFSAGRLRCPRCRTRVAVVDPAAVAARSRRLQIVALSLLAVAFSGVAAVWLLSPGSQPSSVATTGSRRGAPQTAVPNRPRDTTAERPFMDPAGAAYEAYEAGDYDAALTHLKEAIGRNPQDAEALSNLGQVLVRTGRTAEAIPYFDRAIQLNPERWAYHFNRARAAGLLGRWDECISGYRRARQLFPDDYATTYNLALALHKSGDEEGAVTEYQKAVELSPEDAIFRRALAISLERLKRNADAAAAYTEYLKLSPSAPDADKVRERIALLSGAPAQASPPVAGKGPSGA